MRKRFRPTLEQLEPRLLLNATNYWIGGNNNNDFNTAANWTATVNGVVVHRVLDTTNNDIATFDNTKTQAIRVRSTKPGTKFTRCPW